MRLHKNFLYPGDGKKLLLIPSFRIVSSLLLISLLITALTFAPTFGIRKAEAAISLTPPPDKTVAGTGTTTKVGLGTPLVSGTTDSNPTISHDAPGATPPPTGGVAIWNFDNDLKDQSGNSNHGTAVGNAKIDLSYMGRALSLDGDGDYVTVKDSSSLRINGAFSISAWVKFSTTSPAGEYVRVIEKGTPGDKYWMFYVEATKEMGFGFATSSGDHQIRTLKTEWSVGTWYHVAGTFDPALSNNNFKIYVNGVLDNQITDAKNVKPSVNNAQLVIGTKGSKDWDFWEGSLDEIRVYKRALTSTEVTSLFKSPFVSLPIGTNTITWTVKDSTGSTASANQIVTVQDSTAPAPVTTLTLNGVRFADSTGKSFVTSSTHFDLAVESSGTKGTDTFYRYYPSSALSTSKPAFSKGTYFQLSGTNGEYVVEYYSADIGGKTEAINEKIVILDNSSPASTLSSTKVISATDNSGGAGVGKYSSSGIYYKFDSATSYTFVQSSSVDLSKISTTWKTVYYYSVDNVQNKGAVASSTTASSGPTYTFCASGCNYNNLQTAINALPSTGGTILIKDGTYTWSNTITLKSGTNLEFSSGASLYFRGDSKPAFSGNGVNNVSIKGGSITAELQGVKAIAFWSSRGITVDGTKMVLVQGSNSNAFYCVDCIDVYVSNINAKTATRLIDIKTSARDATSNLSKNIWIQNSVLSGASIEGIKVNWCRDINIIGNKVSNTLDNGIDIGFNINTVVKGNTIINTGMPNGAAIHPDGTNTALIQDNYIEKTGLTAIPVYRAIKVDVIGNTIKYAGKEAVSIIDSTDPNKYVNVLSNHIIAPATNGIYQSPSQSYVEIAYNTLEQIPAGYAGIRVVWSNNPTTTVHDNTII